MNINRKVSSTKNNLLLKHDTKDRQMHTKGEQIEEMVSETADLIS